jgi:membrane fusion protein, multidrug efflux system
MKRLSWGILIIAVIIVILAGGYRWFSHDEGQTSKKDSSDLPAGETAGSANEPVVSVKTALIKKGTITEDITVYGTVIPAPGAVQTISLPFESKVRRIFVSNGQRVSQGENLLEIEPSPDTSLKLEQAQSAYESAKEDLKHMQQRFNLKLATNDQLQQAKQAFQQAKLNLQSLKKQGIDGQTKIRADISGLIEKISVQEKSIVPAGSPFIEIVAQNRVEVQLGVEPEDTNHLRVGQPISLSSVNVSASSWVTGRIRAISQSVNPATRLVDVFVELPSSPNRFLLGGYVRGKIEIASKVGIVVPRTAVLPEEDHYVLFTISDGHAKKHTVQVGLESEKDVEVIGSGFHPGEPVVILGNYELKDGMAVKVEASQ